MRNHSAFRLLLCACVLFALPACSIISPEPQGPDPYYAEFSDIPIPRAMSVDNGETSLSYGPGGMKSGVQSFTGRVEVSSLTTAMGGNMTRDGWTLRSAMRSVKSVLVFEKPDRFCTIYILDGWMTTEMRIFVTGKLTQGDVSFPAPVAPALDQAMPVISEEKAGVESYKPGGFSGQSGVQPLN